jgi:hypothetical protein
MKKQIAFLRGINVGNIRIKMPDLKLAFESLGYQQVKPIYRLETWFLSRIKPLKSLNQF